MIIDKIFIQFGAFQKVGDNHIMTLRKWSFEDFQHAQKYVSNDLYQAALDKIKELESK